MYGRIFELLFKQFERLDGSEEMRQPFVNAAALGRFRFRIATAVFCTDTERAYETVYRLDHTASQS